MSKKYKYKTIFFDWNNTLSKSLFWEHLSSLEHERHNWHENITNFIFVEKKHLINDWMRGNFDEVYIAGLIAEKFGYPNDIVLEDLAESCKNMQLVSEEIVELINRARDYGVKCVIATDNMDTFMKYTVPGMKLNNYFDDILVSFDKKVLKFDVGENSIPFFDDYLKNNRLSYNDVVLIDDCIDKSGVYKKLGFDIIQIASTDDFILKLRKIIE